MERQTKWQRYYARHKEQKKMYMRDYYAKNKVRISKWKKTYRAHNAQKVSHYRRIHKQKIRSAWEEGRLPDASKRAEALIKERVLPQLGFNDVYQPTKNFYFDGFAKKNGRVYVFEVGTGLSRTFPNYREEFRAFFRFPLLLFFVKPDLSEYWLITNNGEPISRSFYYKQGRRAAMP